MKLKSLIFAVGLGVIAMSCKKNSVTENTEAPTIDNISVPTGFNWASTREVNLSIGVTDSRFDNAIFVIGIYIGDPSNGGQLLTKGSATLISPFNTKVTIPTSLTEIYALKTAPDGSTVKQQIAITTSTIISAAIGAQNVTKSINAIVIPGIDSDGDGVLDFLDDYPTNAAKAYNNYSVNYTLGGSTAAFEDNWPSKGDYDVNDIVISYRYLVATSASNRVAGISATYTLIATGGSFLNGAGIQFNLPAANVRNFSSTTGNTLESGQDSIVVILFTNDRNEQATYNSRPGEAISPVKTYSISFDVANGPLLNVFGIGNYNPFIWNGSVGYGRGYETHLYGKYPTKLANTALFGTKDDNSINGKYYSTLNKLPFAIEVPIANFKYPIEGVAINNAYLRFLDWAQGGGLFYADWYSNILPGYRDSSKLFNN